MHSCVHACARVRACSAVRGCAAKRIQFHTTPYHTNKLFFSTTVKAFTTPQDLPGTCHRMEYLVDYLLG